MKRWTTDTSTIRTFMSFVLTALGILYQRMGQPRQAIQSFEKAVAADPKNEKARFNKGYVLLNDMKDREGAIRTWEELLEINPLAVTGDNQSVDQLVKYYKEHETNPAK
ncbi:MAG: tetratricopeptide repeat protein [Pseudomonadota bacterium]